MDCNVLKNMYIRTFQDIDKFSEIVLWGAGFAFEDTIDLLGRDKIVAVFDNNHEKWGKTIFGFQIKSPDKELEKYVTDKTAFIISTNGYQYEIAEDLIKNRGISQRQIFCNSNKTVEKWRYRPNVILENMTRIRKVFQRLADQESKDYYINFLSACMTRNPLFYKDNPRSIGNYTYRSELANPGLVGGEVILDCGAYNGDTARLFRQITQNNCEIYCFEPVTENYNELCSWIEKENINKVYAIHVGVGKDKHIDKVFSTEEKTTKGAVGSNRFNSKNPIISQIQVDTLDNMLGKNKVDYIKMDIEGAEMDALKGGAGVIEKNHPKMLISAYHKITDMWEIPDYVLDIDNNYQIFLGHQPHAPYEPEFMFV